MKNQVLGDTAVFSFVYPSVPLHLGQGGNAAELSHVNGTENMEQVTSVGS